MVSLTLLGFIRSGENAIASLSKIVKTLSAENKRFGKKRATLSRRKKTLSAKLKKSPDAATKKLLASTEKEINSIKKLAAKCTASKSVNSEELKALKASAKRTKAYISAISKADAILNKPKKKKRAKKPAKKVEVEEVAA